MTDGLLYTIYRETEWENIMDHNVLFTKNGSIILLKRERKIGICWSPDRQQRPASSGMFLANVFTQRQKYAVFIQDYELH